MSWREVLAATVVIVPTFAPYNQLLLLPGVLLLAGTESIQASLPIRVLLAITAACLIWPWITATTLAGISFFTPAAQRFWSIPLWTSAMTPVSLMACLLVVAARDQPYSSSKIRVGEERNQLATGN